MINNMQVYLNQLKDTKLIDLVQSQPPSIISHIINNYIIESEDFKLNKIKEVDKEGFTALHKACARGLPEIVEILLVNGSDVNSVSNGGETAALLAAKRGNPIVLKLLKDFGADMNIVDLKGQGLAHHAIYNDNVYILMWIETSTEISLNSKDNMGYTPLHLSCINGKLNTMKFLLRKSRTCLDERTSKSRDTCLHLAISNNQLQCVPHILLKSSKKESILCANYSNEEDNSSVFICKNANNKSAADIFMEQSYEYKVSHRSFWYFFFLLQMTNLTQLKINFCMYRFYLAIFPFFTFLLGICLAFMFSQYQIYIFILTSFVCIIYVRLQGHRINNVDTRPNPIFAGAFLAGIFHDLICFFVKIYPRMKGDEWEIVITVIAIPILALSYIILICSDSGQLKISDISKTNFSEFVDHEMKKQKQNNITSSNLPLDRFCTVCEVLPNVVNVKHCKICDICIVNMDHHCLFLMKCISLKNLRIFLILIMFSVVLMSLFIETAIKTMILSCGFLTGANPVEFIICSYKAEPWICTAVIFNSISCLWAAFMLSFQLSMISHNSTAYFHKRSTKSTILQKFVRIAYFFIKGSFYQIQRETSFI